MPGPRSGTVTRPVHTPISIGSVPGAHFAAAAAAFLLSTVQGESKVRFAESTECVIGPAKSGMDGDRLGLAAQGNA
jgi:hypothetical protein